MAGLRRRDRGGLGPGVRAARGATARPRRSRRALGSRVDRRRAARRPAEHAPARGPTAPTPPPACSRRSPCATAGPVDADAHLARLAASARELYGLELPEIVLEPARADGRLRVLARPRDGALAVEVEEHPPGEPPAPVALEPRVLAGGLGRAQVAGPARRTRLARGGPRRERAGGAPGPTCGRCSTGASLTPPADGRLLPGVTRARLLRPPGRPRGAAHARRPRPRGGDRPHLLGPPRHPRRAVRAAVAPRGRAGRRAAPRSRSVGRNVSSYIR